MKKNDKEQMAIAKTLGYREPALPRESLDDAINFLHKQTSDLGTTKRRKSTTPCRPVSTRWHGRSPKK